MMNKRELFEKYFKLDFLSIVGDKVPNVRISMSKVLRHHFIKEIQGAFVYDSEFNEAVRILKIDSSADCRFYVNDIETYDDKKNAETSVQGFLDHLRDIRLGTSGRSDTDSSLNSEDENRIENEIKRHNSEEEIDHGPVLKSLRQSRM